MSGERIDFAGRCVIVTGAGGGLGKAYALALAERGAHVVVNDLGGSVAGGDAGNLSMAEAVVAEIEEAGGSAIASGDSVADADGAARIVAAAMDGFGRIDAVINNAGNMRYDDFTALTGDDLNSLLAVHVGGAFHVSRAAWPHMAKAGYGRLLFTTSNGGMFGSRQLAAYGAAKGGVMGLMHCLADEGAAHGILCNAIMPNAISRLAMSMDTTKLGENPYGRPLGQSLDPRYTAGLALYLVSDRCAVTHCVYSALGNRIGKAFVAVADGWLPPLDHIPSAEDVAANWAAINADAAGYSIPENVIDEFRSVAVARGLAE